MTAKVQPRHVGVGKQRARGADQPHGARLKDGIWRLVDGLVIEAWFFGDELSLLRQLGIVQDPRLRAAAPKHVKIA